MHALIMTNPAWGQMDKETVVKSLSDTHKEISEQEAVINGYLKIFNKENVLSDIDKIAGFFNVAITRHFMKEEIIFSALLESGIKE